MGGRTTRVSQRKRADHEAQRRVNVVVGRSRLAGASIDVVPRRGRTFCSRAFQQQCAPRRAHVSVGHRRGWIKVCACVFFRSLGYGCVRGFRKSSYRKMNVWVHRRSIGHKRFSTPATVSLPDGNVRYVEDRCRAFTPAGSADIFLPLFTAGLCAGTVAAAVATSSRSRSYMQPTVHFPNIFPRLFTHACHPLGVD